MSDVQVPFGDNPSETATLLLAAAEELGDQSVVRTSAGAFTVPEEVAKRAGFGADDKEEKPAKKAPAKKAAKKK